MALKQHKPHDQSNAQSSIFKSPARPCDLTKNLESHCEKVKLEVRAVLLGNKLSSTPYLALTPALYCQL